ncbi:hypothetical protein RCL1_006167 [Eukaryota sp. TZLM3-RCL]
MLFKRLSKQARVQLFLTASQIFCIQCATYLASVFLALFFLPFGRPATVSALFHPLFIKLYPLQTFFFVSILSVIAALIVLYVVVDSTKILDFSFTFHFIHFLLSLFYSPSVCLKFLFVHLLGFFITTLIAQMFSKNFMNREIPIKHKFSSPIADNE